MNSSSGAFGRSTPLYKGTFASNSILTKFHVVGDSMGFARVMRYVHSSGIFAELKPSTMPP